MSLAIGLWCVACMALTVAGSLWPQKLLGAWDACSSAPSGDLSLLQCPIPEDTSFLFTKADVLAFALGQSL